MGKKKRHHYVPRFYLEGFIDPKNKPYIWIYEKGKQYIKKATAKDIAVEKHYYSFITETGTKDSETFEDAFAELETKSAPILQNIKSGEAINDQEKQTLSYFIAYTMTRVPNYRKNIESIGGKLIKKSMKMIVSDKEVFKNKVNKLEKERGEKFKHTVEDYIEAIQKDLIDVKVHPGFSLGMIGIAKELAPIFYKMDWAFLKATDEYDFLTSDNPLYYFDPTYSPKTFDGIGLLHNNIEVYFPISRNIMLIGTWKNFKGYHQLKNKHVRDINKRTVIFALRFIFSSKKSQRISVLVQKYKDTHYKLFKIE